MKKLLLVLLPNCLLPIAYCLLPIAHCLLPIAYSQTYWQQEVNYNIDITLNDQDHTLKGNADIEYINNSPDRLEFIWFHLWPNAYKNENTAFVKQLYRDKEGGKKRWKEMKDKGYIDSLNFLVNGTKARIENHPEYIDVIKLLLPAPLKPGEKIQIATPFFVKLPTYNSRSGHLGQSYMVCQWYPKPAVYDRKGWHPMPYLDQGEFYSEFGKFEVSITVPAQYIVGATGILQTVDELNKYKEIGKRNILNQSGKNIIPYKREDKSVLKTLLYTGEKIHDFAWFADKDFVIRYDTLELSPGKIIDVFAYHHPDGNSNWVKSTNYIEDAVRSYSTWIGEYPYPTVAAVEGPKNDMSGGMEYPMITLITVPRATEEYLDAVITHEVGHNWFYGILATNERKHAWLDEGINTYYQILYEAQKYKSNMIFGNAIPEDVKNKPLPEFLAIIYGAMSDFPMYDAIETEAALFKNKNDYGVVEYIKTAIWMYIIEISIGKETLDKAVRGYYDEWKFKHPYPEDLKEVFEKETGVNMDNFFDALKKKGKLN